MIRLGYHFIYKHEVDVQRDAEDVVTLLASGELAKLPPGRVVGLSDKWHPVDPGNGDSGDFANYG